MAMGLLFNEDVPQKTWHEQNQTQESALRDSAIAELEIPEDSFQDLNEAYR